MAIGQGPVSAGPNVLESACYILGVSGRLVLLAPGSSATATLLPSWSEKNRLLPRELSNDAVGSVKFTMLSDIYAIYDIYLSY